MDRRNEIDKSAVKRRDVITLSSSSNNVFSNKQGDRNSGMDSSIEVNTKSSSFELPFLVTHWLATYDCKIPRHGEQCGDSDEASKAIQKIHRAAAEIASAFSTLSSFGTNVQLTPLDHDPLDRQFQAKQLNRTYGELKRQWGKHCPPNQLEILVHAAQSVNGAVESAITEKKITTTEFATNIGMAAREKVIATIHKPNAGRTLLDSVDINDTSDDNNPIPYLLSLHPPILLPNQIDMKTTKDITGIDPTITIQSSYRKAAIEASLTLRQLIEVRIKQMTTESRFRSLNRSLGYHKKMMTDLIQRRNLILARQSQNSLETMHTALSTNGSCIVPQVIGVRDYGSLLTELDDIDSEEQNGKRVIAQLEREIPGVARLRDEDLRKIAELQKMSQVLFERTKDTYINYNDPIPVLYGKEKFSSNRLLFNLHTRQMGYIDRCNGRNLPIAMGRKRPLGAHIENQKAILYNRFSYAGTINSHLHYPVYCLRFDRTGRYFITGADDYLVRVFCLGENVFPKGHGKLDRSTFMRGAVLVCTLKGHAGVVNDICVSSDNCFLATASDDGDCRVWGLRDGTPVAILRGHEGGANMVSWSSLTPYRLVTTSADGLARIWDIREACLNRYGNLVRKRAEYNLKLDGVSVQAIMATSNTKSLTENENISNQDESTHTDDNGPHRAPQGVPLPPLPQNADAEDAPQVASVSGRSNDTEQQNGAGVMNNAEDQNGQFVFNDMIDEGVKLIAKLQHGASRDERASAPGTRSRQSTVKVICVARCPFGGHFATGSDDGICRIWRDDDDILVERIDAELCGRQMANQLPRHTTRKNSDPLLLVLEGHLSAITDLAYSSSGDRILSASQKDGLVQICSWSSDPSLSNKPGGVSSPSKRTPGSSISKISIKLVSPRLAVSSLSAPKRRANSKPPTSHIACDVATWVQDDSKVATSQSELVKANGSDIVPGSHYIFLWESSTGHCLLGIAGAHTKPCPLLIAHPTDSSIMCSASADGMVKIWDWETCKCLYSHANAATFGPLEEEQLGKNLGYLDGSFSPDGTKLVLTDDSGRITVLDCNTQAKNVESSFTEECPIWMKEQYFSNDYYDLIYDNTGYCVEKGSEQPPHLAPRGSRCSHTGAAVESVVNETFSGLHGPLPLSEESCRWNREEIRSKAEAMIAVTQGFKGNFIRQFDPHTTMMLQDGVTKSIASIGDAAVHDVETTRPIASTNVNNQPSGRTGRLLSRNYRWGDAYEDAIRAGDDGPEIESDDEEFEINERTSAALNDEDLDDSMQSDDDLSPLHRPVNGNSADSTAPRARTSSRQRRSLFESEGDSDDDDAEFLSTNNLPTGIFASDYNVHFFKLPGRVHVSRLWLRRLESISSREGRKKYSPQIGDLVVYIPRAHLDTVHNFPNLFAPWLHWPNEACWPVVECKIRNIRYRFPFIEFWNNKVSGSVVAILTLEVVGIPETAYERDHPWPKPEFTPATSSHLFEVCVFENCETEFIIPSSLYKTRLRNLENAIEGGGRNGKLRIQVYYESEKNVEDDEFQAFTGTLHAVHDEADISSIPQLQGSGYNSVTVEWSNGQKDKVNPWEINVADSPVTKFVNLDESVKKRFAQKIVKLKDDYSIFSNPVDETRYSDYLMRVEVPMDLSFMLKRLEYDYYMTMFSVIADMRLIVENCAKYNGEHDGLTRFARRMLDDFEISVLSPEDRKSFHEFNVPLKIPASVELSPDGRPQSEHAAPSLPQRPPRVSAGHPRRESTRYNQPVRSSLESLPQPEESQGGRPVSSRRQFRTHAPRGNGNEGQQRGLHNRVQYRNQNVNNNRLGRRRPNARSPDRTNTSARPSNTIRIRLGASQSRAQQAVDDRTQSSQSHPMIPLPGAPRDNAVVEHRPPVPTTDSVQSSHTHGMSNENGEEMQRSSDSLFGQIRNGNRKRNREYASQTQLETGDSLAALARMDESFDNSSRDDGDSSTRPAKKNCVFDEMKPQALLQIHSMDSTDKDLSNYSSQNPTNAEDEYVDERESSARTDQLKESRKNSGRLALRRKVSRDGGNRGDETGDSDADSPNESSAGSIHTGFSSSSQDDVSDDDDNQSDESSKLRHRPRSTRKHNPKRSVVSSKTNKQNGHTPKAKAHSPPRKKPSSQLASKDSPPRRTTSRSSTSRKLRKSAAAQKSYVDPSSSEFDSTIGGSSDSESSAGKPPRKQRAIQQSGRRKYDSKDKPGRKGTRPAIKEWPEISQRHISRVAKAIISRLAKLDTLGLFAVPVLETYPDLLVAYRIKVKQPMDFRTISQDRISGYTSINELRSDLILTFKNCIAFNGEDSEEGVEARKMLSQMYDIFKVVCDLNFITILQED